MANENFLPQVFEHEKFGKIRALFINGKIYFVAADVCRALELTNPTVAVSRLDADEKAKFNLGLSGGATNCVNEPGLYRLIFASRKKEAREFQRWVYHEVLPSIRQTGGYGVVAPYVYIQKFFKGKAAFTVKDIAAFAKVPELDIYNAIKYEANGLKEGRDYEALAGNELAEFKRANYFAVSANTSVLYVFNIAGATLLFDYFKVKLPKPFQPAQLDLFVCPVCGNVHGAVSTYRRNEDELDITLNHKHYYCSREFLQSDILLSTILRDIANIRAEVMKKLIS